MTTEVSITINDLGNVSCCTSETLNAEIPLDDIRKDPSTWIFVVQDPHELKKLFEHPTPETVEIRDGMGKLRLKILHPISGGTVELWKKNTAVLKGRTCLDSSRVGERPVGRFRGSTGWRNLSSICPVIRGIEIGHIVRSLQHISTTMSLKARGTFRCQVQCCDAERIEWLKRSLVGI